MKLDICIVDGSKIDAKILKVILESYLEERHFDYTIKTYDTGLAFYSDFEEGYIHPTTLFMDIFLPQSNGLEICKKMRNKGYAGDVLITTATKDHALEAFKVDARAYILKPYNSQDVFEVLARICRYAQYRTYILKTRQRQIRIPVSEIVYVESNESICTFHCLNNIIYTIRKKLDAVEEELHDEHFLRCHKSYLVNMDYITAASEEFTLYTGDLVPIRKTDIKAMKDAYESFMEKYK